jgi:hypothetical protein
MRHLWALPPIESVHEDLLNPPRVCNGCGIRVEQRERSSLKARTPGQMVSVPVYILPGECGVETERLPDCDRHLLIPRTPAARPSPVEELAELKVRFGQVQKENERLFMRDVAVRGILGADLSESTEAAAERVRSFSTGGAR